MSALQQTIGKEVTYSGIGVHTGNTTSITFKPAPTDHGYVFIRADLPGKPRVEVDPDNVVIEDAIRQTALGHGEERIYTVEHALSAVRGLGIDNVIMEVEGNELPIGDGSAKPFVDVLLEAGLESQDRPRNVITLNEPIWLFKNGLELAVVPSNSFEITFKINYDHPAIGIRSASFPITPETFVKEIAPARTFCFLKDVEEIRAQGKIKGGSLDCALVIDDEGFVNDDLRFEDEIIRHKILDVIGDFALLGAPLQAHVVAVRSGHQFNVEFVRKIERTLGIKKGRPVFNVPFGVEDIRRVLPHRYPFLLVDRITRIDPENGIFEGYKQVSGNEPFFQGHFPDQPIMPGVLIIESMSQVGGAGILSLPENQGKYVYLLGVDKAKFRKPVVPGDRLEVECRLIKLRKTIGTVECRAKVDGQLVTEALVNFAIVKQEAIKTS
jgi:UDP-3-O-[3-hydroxymyristoyl] N-acetylglucosamine deacetylase/3-hydroxyacyl-[acyl-carrier-protein] dehydratase